MHPPNGTNFFKAEISYVQGTLYFLTYNSKQFGWPTGLEIFRDADFSGDDHDRKSMIGALVSLNDQAIA